jgi:hypothetical protein
MISCIYLVKVKKNWLLDKWEWYLLRPRSRCRAVILSSDLNPAKYFAWFHKMFPTFYYHVRLAMAHLNSTCTCTCTNLINLTIGCILAWFVKGFRLLISPPHHVYIKRYDELSRNQSTIILCIMSSPLPVFWTQLLFPCWSDDFVILMRPHIWRF